MSKPLSAADAGTASASSACYAVGDQVVARRDVFEPVSDDAPGGLLCTKGDVLIIRELKNFRIYVSHPDVTDNSFWVYQDEIRPHNAGVSVAANKD